MRAKITKIGKWPQFARLAANLTYELNRAYYLSLKRWGLKAEGIAKRHISSQDLANWYWKPLRPNYVKWKAKKGYSLDTYVMTSTYFQNITTWVDRVQGVCYVGLKRGVLHKSPEGVYLMEDIARVQEFGSVVMNIPARPLWKPTLESTMEWHLKNNLPGDIFLDIIRKKYS